MTSALRLQQVRNWISRHSLGRRLRRRLLIWFALFSLVPLLVTNSVGYIQSQRIIERQATNYLQGIASVEARHVRDQIERQQMALELITAGNEFLAAGTVEMSGGSAGQMGRAASREAVRRYLQSKLNELPALEALRLYARDGRVLVTAMRSGAHRSDIPGAKTAGFFVVPTLTSQEPPRFHLVEPVRRSGITTGFLGGIISATVLPAFLEIPRHLDGKVHTIVVDEQGRPLFISNPVGPVDYMRPHPIAIHAGEDVVQYTDRWGTRLIASSAMVPGTRWTFVTEMPETSVLGPLRALRRTSSVLEGAFIVLLSLVAWLVARTIVRPIRNLVAAARRVAAGDLSARVQVNDTDEIGELGTTFNDMTAALAEASVRVEQLHQEQIERAQQLATVGELASGVAHEIKNPVVGISNGLDLVRRRIGDEPVIAPIMDEMTRQIARIDSAVKDLLEFARPSSPTLAPVPGGLVVERALRLVQPAAANAGLNVDVRYDCDLPVALLDEELVTQAFVNVLMNAVQATPPGGKISVRTRATAQHIEFTICDTGRGMSPDVLEQIYKPFFTTRHSGTGLGLSITRDTIEHHGGTIHAQTALGRGTTFTIRLPLTPATEAERIGSEVTV
jgi:signal transduction histidine kinase